MKYMGSKRHLLQNGLGDKIRSEGKTASRFIDLFAGSAAVSWFAANQTKTEVVAVDLQSYTAVLAESVLSRKKIYNYKYSMRNWFSRSQKILSQDPHWQIINLVEKKLPDLNNSVKYARELCNSTSPHGPIWSAYGGHYFSPRQALIFDVLRSQLPVDEPHRTVALASLISAASDCAASPGHTAQPLQPTPTGLRHILESWRKDPFDYVEVAMADISSRFSNNRGRSHTGDANEFINQANSSDLIFIDPPYSDVHYSRFYHVLETISRGECGEVSGTGRYPPFSERPASDYSRKGQAANAMKQLLNTIAESGSRAIITYPERMCSNNLSGKIIEEIAKEWFNIDSYTVNKKFSTLGGNSEGSRPARQDTGEMVITLKPK